jgi:dolichol-phosphate mannosyltransferase
MNLGIVVPMANEEKDFQPFVMHIKKALDQMGFGKVYFVVDKASKDNTLACCNDLSAADERFATVWSPQNKNVVDAYINGYRHALAQHHEYIIEMDAGMSHNPSALSSFVTALSQGYAAVYGTRFALGGSIINSNWRRKLLSKGGTILTNLLLGSKLSDMTSGYQGFHRSVVEKFCKYNLLSQGHFYQTELRYLLRNVDYKELPIQYQAPSPSVSRSSIYNSISVLMHLFWCRLKGKPKSI